MGGDQKTAQIIMLEDSEKEQEYEKNENEKRKRADSEPSRSRQSLNIELERFMIDLSNPIAKPAAEIEEVELYAGCSGENGPHWQKLGAGLKEKVIAIIRKYLDVFSWGPEDMPGLDPNTAKHCLNVKLEAKVVKLKNGPSPWKGKRSLRPKLRSSWRKSL